MNMERLGRRGRPNTICSCHVDTESGYISRITLECHGLDMLPHWQRSLLKIFLIVNAAEHYSFLSLPLFPFVRGEVMPATFSLPHLLVFSTLLCLVSSSSSLPPLLPSSHLSLHSPPISALASLVSSCPALVTLPLSTVIDHRPSFLRVQPTVICS